MSNDDKTLWQAFWLFESDEFRNALVVRYMPLAIAATIRATAGDPRLFDDAYQNSCLELIRAVSVTEKDTEEPESYLWSCCYWGARKGLATADADLPDSLPCCPSTDVGEYLDGLVDGHIVRMRLVDGLLFSTIATRLNDNPVRVSKRYYDALDVLRESLQ